MVLTSGKFWPAAAFGGMKLIARYLLIRLIPHIRCVLVMAPLIDTMREKVLVPTIPLPIDLHMDNSSGKNLRLTIFNVQPSADNNIRNSRQAGDSLCPDSSKPPKSCIR